MMDSGTISLPSPFHGSAQTLIYCRSLKTSSSISGSDLSQILVFLPRLRRLTIAGGLDQLAAFANFQSSTVIQLNVLDWTPASIDLLSENNFPALQFLSINLDQATIIDEVTIVQRIIEKSFDTISTLINLHYSNTMTNQDFTSSINSNRYLHFYNVHIEKRRIIIWK
ncbi:unnamed protein product [Rotaria sp. Silwood1]|nr:unnamed protein product [Rotaria sp. Silwood1]CAF1642395.1 unnamed protein product [Rotaria sp. Silwood1]CAF3830676.1 unnamed protein product [Rotaria sp. Silwood1]CAF4794467.1 unnamed protein product [Rotaria sp. Silwood1]